MSPGNLDSNLCFFQPSISPDVLCILVKWAGWQYTALTYSFSYWELVCCSTSSSNCSFLTCMQVSQEAGQVVWYSHLLQNFPQFVVIHKSEAFQREVSFRCSLIQEPFVCVSSVWCLFSKWLFSWSKVAAVSTCFYNVLGSNPIEEWTFC